MAKAELVPCSWRTFRSWPWTAELSPPLDRPKSPPILQDGGKGREGRLQLLHTPEPIANFRAVTTRIFLSPGSNRSIPQDRCERLGFGVNLLDTCELAFDGEAVATDGWVSPGEDPAASVTPKGKGVSSRCECRLLRLEVPQLPGSPRDLSRLARLLSQVSGNFPRNSGPEPSDLQLWRIPALRGRPLFHSAEPRIHEACRHARRQGRFPEPLCEISLKAFQKTGESSGLRAATIVELGHPQVPEPADSPANSAYQVFCCNMSCGAQRCLSQTES